MRERSRAFIVADATAPSNRVVFINAGMSLYYISSDPSNTPAPKPKFPSGSILNKRCVDPTENFRQKDLASDAL